MPRKSLLFYLCCSFFSIDEIIAAISAPSCHACPSGYQERVADFSERQSFVSVGNVQNLKASTLFVCSWRTKPLHGNCPISILIIKYPVTGILHEGPTQSRSTRRLSFSLEVRITSNFRSLLCLVKCLNVRTASSGVLLFAER